MKYGHSLEISPVESGAPVALDDQTLRRALLIRRVEETFLELFAAGKLNGTVHTSIGQEISALAFAGALRPTDSIVSSHRCHGHFIAATGEYRALVAELLGKRTGVCAGIGSSQHLQSGRFFSNGVQGGIVPVCAGMALAEKLRGTDGIATVFIGDGTLGEGALYEALNMAAIWSLPLLVVCEDNGYAQSTPKGLTVAGDVEARARAFGIRTFAGNTWDPGALFELAREAIAYARSGKPAFVHVQTYRLAPHSKGDDDRDPAEIEAYAQRDPLAVALRARGEGAAPLRAEVDRMVAEAVNDALAERELGIQEYYTAPPAAAVPVAWVDLERIDRRQVELVNEFFHETMDADETTIFLGEDVLSPYGGAFKVARGLSERHPERVFTTPISEAGIVGVANGLALSGFRPYVEIMFGDFVTLCFDQIVNHASKFRRMYAGKVRCPLVVRTPMGGRRGYGPTHSQTLDKFLCGIDDVAAVALNALVDPRLIYRSVHALREDPTVVIENKLDYGRKLAYAAPPGYRALRTDGPFPTARVCPKSAKPTVTVVAYGGAAIVALESIEPAFAQCEELAEVVVPSLVCPIDLEPILESVAKTRALVVVEEGNGYGGFGAELVAVLAERTPGLACARVSALPVPIPSAKSLESRVLPQVDDVLEAMLRLRR